MTQPQVQLVIKYWTIKEKLYLIAVTGILWPVMFEAHSAFTRFCSFDL